MKEDAAKQYQTVLSAQAINKISGEDEDPLQEEDDSDWIKKSENINYLN